MPCNGVAVASGRVENYVADYIKEADKETLKQALIAYLTQQFPNLAGKPVEDLPYRYDLGQTYLGFKLGRYMFEVQDYGKVTVSVARQKAGDRETNARMQESLVGFLSGLAGIALQQRIVQQIKDAGYQIEGQQTAPNGALVLSVEV